MSSLSSMPDEVLRAILRHLPLKDRIKGCFLVSRSLLAAAAAATEHFQLDFRYMSTQHAESALRWLSHYGQHLTHLDFSSLEQQLLQLPCENLLELKLHSLEVQLGTADGQPGVLQTCTKLTRLELSCRTLDAPVDGLVDVGLSRLVYLQHLKVGFDAHGLSSAALPRLQHLTHLDLTLNSLSKENLLQLSGLTSLQELGYTADSSDDALAVGPSNIPGFTLPAPLKKLWLSAPVEAGILSVVPAGLQALSIDSPMEGPAEGPGSLLSCMARLQHLTGLDLTPMGSSLRWPPAGPAYSALTASSNLVDLVLAESSFPLGVWPYVFAGLHRLPHLTALIVQHADDVDVFADSTPWTAADLSSLISCCPSLCSVHRLFLQPGLHVSELRKLTALTCIAIDFAANATSAAEEYVSGLAAVTQLQHLDLIAQSPNVTPASLMTLTSLTALTHLSLDFRYGHWLFHCAQDGSPPDVWLQLLERCAAAEPDCQPTALRTLAQQLAEQRAHIHLLQQQIAHQQQQIAAMQQLSEEQQQLLSQEQRVRAQQEQCIAGLQEQLSAQQQTTAVQGALIVGMQAHLSAQQEAAAQQAALTARLQAHLQELLQRQQL